MGSTFQIPSNDYWFLGEKNNKFIFLARKHKFLGNCIGNSGFLEGIFAQIPRSPEGILKIPRATRRARGLERRPEFGAKRRTPAEAEARGPGGLPEGFSKSPTGWGDRWRRFPTKNPNLVHIFYESHFTSSNKSRSKDYHIFSTLYM